MDRPPWGLPPPFYIDQRDSKGTHSRQPWWENTCRTYWKSHEGPLLLMWHVEESVWFPKKNIGHIIESSKSEENVGPGNFKNTTGIPCSNICPKKEQFPKKTTILRVYHGIPFRNPTWKIPKIHRFKMIFLWVYLPFASGSSQRPPRVWLLVRISYIPS